MLWLVGLGSPSVELLPSWSSLKDKVSGSQILSNWAILIRVDSRQCLFLKFHFVSEQLRNQNGR